MKKSQISIDETKYLKLEKSKKSFWIGNIFIFAVYLFYMILLGFIAKLLNTTTPVLATFGTLFFILTILIEIFVWKGASYYVGESDVVIIRRTGMRKIPLEKNDEFEVFTGFLGKIFDSGDYSISNPLTGSKFKLVDIKDPYGTLDKINTKFGRK